MKMMAIAFKDWMSAFRNAFSLVMMFLAPLTVTGLLYLAFGNIGSDGHRSQIPLTRVAIVNEDAASAVVGGGVSVGAMLADYLHNPQLADLVAVEQLSDWGEAMASVDRRLYDVAVLIPTDFSSSAFSKDSQASVVLYQDPALTLGPAVLRELVTAFVDGFSGAKIAADVTFAQLSVHGHDAGPELMTEVMLRYAAWAEQAGSARREGRSTGVRYFDINAEAQSFGERIIGPIMASMMVFFVFFTGASAAETIVREDEKGTLARLFTTPTPRWQILGGKYLSILLILLVQTLVLITSARLLFGVQWGHMVTVFSIAGGMIIAAAGMGVFVMSFVKDTRQSGPVLGGVLTLSGMMGGLFTSGIPNPPAILDTVSLFVPQGWALRGWRLALDGATAAQVLPSILILALMGLAMFVTGSLFFRRRFAQGG